MNLIGYNKDGNSYELVFERQDERILRCTVENGYGLRDLLLNGEDIVEIDHATAVLLEKLRERAYQQRLKSRGGFITPGGLELVSKRHLNYECQEAYQSTTDEPDASVVTVVSNYFRSQQKAIEMASEAYYIAPDYRIVPIKTPPKRDSLPIYVDNPTTEHQSYLGKLVGGQLCPWGEPITAENTAQMQLRKAGYDPDNELDVQDFYRRAVPPGKRASAGTRDYFTLVDIPHEVA